MGRAGLRSNFACVNWSPCLCISSCSWAVHDHTLTESIRQLETEINEKLVDIHQKLLQAGVDQKESERETKMKENLANLQRIFPGVRGRVVDLCKPTQRKYETAVATVLGRNIDAIVVDEEKTAIDCIEVG